MILLYCVFKIYHHKLMLVSDIFLHNQYSSYVVYKPHIQCNTKEFQHFEQFRTIFLIEKANKYDYCLLIINIIWHNEMMLFVEIFCTTNSIQFILFQHNHQNRIEKISHISKVLQKSYPWDKLENMILSSSPIYIIIIRWWCFNTYFFRTNFIQLMLFTFNT